MADTITLSCPSCGYKLQIAEDIDRFASAACGKQQVVNQSGSNVMYKPIIERVNEKSSVLIKLQYSLGNQHRNDVKLHRPCFD